MMTGTIKNRKITSLVLLILTAVLVCVVWGASLALGRPNVAHGETEYVMVDSTAVTSFINAFGSSDDTGKAAFAPQNGVVQTASQFCYVFMSGKAEAYTLGANFKITDKSWFNNCTGLVKNASLDGNGYKVWCSARAGSDALNTNCVGGLCAVNQGTITNFDYYYDGYIYVQATKEFSGTVCGCTVSNSIASGILCAGGMIGSNYGTISNSRIETAGIVFGVCKKNESMGFCGGMFGKNGGTITGCELVSTSEVSVYSNSEVSETGKKSKLFSGGVAGVLCGGGFNACEVLVQADVSSHDFTKNWAETGVGFIDDIIGDYVATHYNDGEHVHPAGCFVGGVTADAASYIKSCNMNIGGSAFSESDVGGNNKGTVAGGLIGQMLKNSDIKVQGNVITLTCGLSAFFGNNIDITQIGTIINAIGRAKPDVYVGGLVGLATVFSDGSPAASSTFVNNAVIIDGDNDIVEGGVSYTSDDVDAHGGLLSGSTELGNYIGANNWLVRNLTDCNTGRVMGNEPNLGGVNSMNIFGSGKVGAEITAGSATSITFTAKPQTSPFYGWTDDIIKGEMQSTELTKKYSSMTGTVVFPIFIDNSIESSGELTQFAYDVNLIKDKVWADLYTQNSKNLMYYSGSGKITLSWLNVNLTKDITVEKGTPVIEEFYGTFNGNGHTINFASGSVIKHDYEQPENDDDAEFKYNEFNTGLFGIIGNGATVANFKLVFGGAMVEEDGLELELHKNAEDELGKAIYNMNGKNDENSVLSRTFALNQSFVYPAVAEDVTTAWFLNSGASYTGYSSSKAFNPGYFTVEACVNKDVVGVHYMGALAGKNCGTVSGVEVEITQSGYIACRAKTVYCGGMIGCNEGTVNNSSVSFGGQIRVRASANAYVGGLMGANTSSVKMSNLSSYVTGSIDVTRTAKAHKITYYQYAATTQISAQKDLPDGFEIIARDMRNNQGGNFTLENAFCAKDFMGTRTTYLYTEGTATAEEIVGALVGYMSTVVDFENCVASSDDESVFNTAVVTCDSNTAVNGSLIGYSQSVPSFTNTWVASSYSTANYSNFNYDSLGSDKPVVGNLSSFGNANRIYVLNGVVVPRVDSALSLPVNFTVEAKSGMTFAGWYDIASGSRTVIKSGLNGAVFTPQNQTASQQVLLAELISTTVFTENDINKIAQTTNEGRGYEGVTFTLGSDITLNSCLPIGTVEAPFIGTFNGSGMTVTLKGFNPSAKQQALFGCVGLGGNVKNITVCVDGALGNGSISRAGAVAAINYGVIGQDSSNAKVKAVIKGSFTANIVGGIVGENLGTVKNCEVTFNYTDSRHYGELYAENSASGEVAVAGGAIGKNSAGAVAKNIIVYFPSEDVSGVISSTQAKYYLGGAVGHNEADAGLYSVVSVCTYADNLDGEYGSNNANSKLRGMCVGYNESTDVDALWVLYSSSDLGAPISVYNGEEAAPTTDELVVLNGECNLNGNVLIKYGAGSVNVYISGSATASNIKGGDIAFESSPIAGGKDFYGYVEGFETGVAVSLEDGNTGMRFTPAVTKAKTTATCGKVYYAAFADSTISSADELKALAAQTASDYRLYVNYNLSANMEYNLASAGTLIGANEEYPFVGSFNGNGYTVTFVGSASHGLFGVVGRNDGKCYSEVTNLKVLMQAGSSIVSAQENAGIVAEVNNGVVSNVSVVVRGFVSSSNGNVGAVCGTNNGYVRSATVTVEFINYLGSDATGMLYGSNAGGVAGVNNGVIGGDSDYCVKVTLSDGGSYGGVIYAQNNAGGVVGVNNQGGKLYSIMVTVQGTLGSAQNAGGVVGTNSGTVYNSYVADNDELCAKRGTHISILDKNYDQTAYVYIEKSAKIFGVENFGGVAGVNGGAIGDSKPDKGYEKFVKVFINAPLATSASGEETFGGAVSAKFATKVFGGVAGVNSAEAEIVCVTVDIQAAESATLLAGGVAGTSDGSIAHADVMLRENGTMAASTCGGVAGVASGDIGVCYVELRGTVGKASCTVGGIVGETTAKISDSVVVLSNNLVGAVAGLVAAVATEDAGSNVWAEISNASTLKASTTANTGFNVLKVVGDDLLTAGINTTAVNQISFESIKAPTGWYTDISAWTTDGYGILTTGLNATKSRYQPSVAGVKDAEYYVAFTSLNINNSTTFVNMHTLINSNSYYNGVLFILSEDINVAQGEVFTPIGNKDYPFNAIFEGGYHTVTFQYGSVISGVAYSGVFGYTAENSVIRNMIVNIEDGVALGSVVSTTVGGFVGHSAGSVQNVFVNLEAGIVSNDSFDAVGAFAGYVENGGVGEITNCWISILNDVAPAVGNADGENCYGVNSIGVLGYGATDVKWNGNYALGGAYESVTVTYYVPTYTADDAAYYKAMCDEYYKGFGGWFADIRSGVKLQDVASYQTLYGTVTQSAESGDISLSVVNNAQNKKLVLSFINISIYTEQDFIRFASDINTYGDQGAQFTLYNDIAVNFDNCASVGTAAKPFTGVFEGNGHTVFVSGNMIKRNYSGVFGVVGAKGVVRNLKVTVRGENVVIGDSNSIYSALIVSSLYGSAVNCVGTLRADTKIVCPVESGKGGIIGRAHEGYNIDNCWLVLAENCGINVPVSNDDYYMNNKTTNGEARVMQMVGQGSLKVTVTATSVKFDAEDVNGDDGRQGFYGFVDNNVDGDNAVPVHDKDKSNLVWTVNSGDNTVSNFMLVVFIDSEIKDEADLIRLADNVEKGRNYRGITYLQTQDIVITSSGYTPIGGQVELASSSAMILYEEHDFIGGYNAQGHSITLPESVTVAARYAGVFGRTGEYARIRNLTVYADCTFGVDTGDNTTRTLYAGVLSAYSAGGKFENNVVVMNKRCTLYGSMGTGRTFGYLPYASADVATNCFVVCYNSRVNFELNEQELLFNAGYTDAQNYQNEGANQGGVNTVMVVAAGAVEVNRKPQDVGQFYFSYSGTPDWYALNDFETKIDAGALASIGVSAGVGGGVFTPDKAAKRTGYNVSFLDNEIASVEALNNFAANVNSGYNFYKLSFRLTADLVIEKSDNFVPIGSLGYGLNGEFDGNYHSITLAAGATIEGRYAGIFGYVDADGTVKNLKVVLKGEIGANNHDAQAVQAGAVNSAYAGAIAYNAGNVSSVVVVADGVKCNTLEGESGIAIGHDATNLVNNVWVLTDSGVTIPAVGGTEAGITSGVNVMTVIGIGKLHAVFEGAQIKFVNDETVAVMGWYKDYAKNNELSSAMVDGGSLASGNNGYFVVPVTLFGVHYEVAVIKTVIETAGELIAIAEDVNIGGYGFDNITFTLGADIELPDLSSGSYTAIGTEKNPFKGTFSGKHDGVYHTITVRRDYGILGLFGYNAGTVSDLSVTVTGTVGETTDGEDHVYGVVANVNTGRVQNCFVTVANGGKVTGYTVGGIAGQNSGVIENCIVKICEYGSIESVSSKANAINAGGLVGINYGTVSGTQSWSEWEQRGLPTATRQVETFEGSGVYEPAQYYLNANVFVYGEVSAVGYANGGYANAGGAVGNNYSGTSERIVVYVMEEGKVVASSPTAGGARAGGVLGASRATLMHSVVFLNGNVVSDGVKGGSVGFMEGTARNSWLVLDNRTVNAVGSGYNSINVLNVKGNGKVIATIDTSTGSVMFTNVTDDNGSRIDGWYTAANVEVTSAVGNVGDDNKSTFMARVDIVGRSIMVVFVNTEIYSVEDLADMARSVNSGLSGTELVFRLMNDISIDTANNIGVIGGEGFAFNNVFDGQGHTVYIHSLPVSATQGGLFGTVGEYGIIKNLNVVYDGIADCRDIECAGVLAGYNRGVIENCTVEVESGAVLSGNVMGCVSGYNYGSINSVKVTIAGQLIANGNVGSKIVGGVAGVNGKTVAGCEVTVTEAGVIAAEAQSGIVYAGAIAGENFETVSRCGVTMCGLVTAQSGTTGYASAGVALNQGSLQNVYVELGGGKMQGDVCGGIIANNGYSVKDSLVVASAALPSGGDAAIGRSGEASRGYVKNTWVFADSTSVFSAAAEVNNIAAESAFNLTKPTKQQVYDGNIAFGASIAGITDKVAMFAVVSGGACYAATGAELENVSYQSGTIRYISTTETFGKSVLLSKRGTIASATELAAFAMAVNSGEYTFDECEFTLASSFEITDTDWTAIGTEASPVPASVTFNGNYNVITVGQKANLENGLFGCSKATVKNIGLRLVKDETVNGISLVNANDGRLENAVVYLEENSKADLDSLFVAEGEGAVDNAWIVARYDVDATTAYSVMRINGMGDVVASAGKNGMDLIAVTNADDMLFIGWTVQGEKLIFDTGFTFETAGKTEGGYTAEFLSKVIDTEYKLKVLSDVTSYGYDGKGETFTFGSDITLTGTLTQFNNYSFLGAINGNGYTLTVTDDVVLSVFGGFGGKLSNLIIVMPHVDNAQLSVKLFDSTLPVVMTDCVIVENGPTLKIGANVSSSNVYVQTANADLVKAFTEKDSEYAKHYSLVYTSGLGGIVYGIDNGVITATALDCFDDNGTKLQVFAGWYKGNAAIKNQVAVLDNAAAGNVYQLNFINSEISAKEDLLRLASASAYGFDFDGETFVIDGSITVDEGMSVITSFNGKFVGKNNAEIVFDTPLCNAFMGVLNGEISSVTFRYVSGEFNGEGALLAMINNGTMNAVSVIEESGFDAGSACAGIAYKNDGVMNNCWYVTSGSRKPVANGTLGANLITAGNAACVSVHSVEEGQRAKIVFEFASAEEGKYIVLCNADGTVCYPANYDYENSLYTASFGAENTVLAVKCINTVASQDELVYLGYATQFAGLTDCTVTLTGDITVSRVLTGISLEGIVLDACGNKITLANVADGYLFDGGVRGGEITNAVITLTAGACGIACGNITLSDSVLDLPQKSVVLPGYTVFGVTVVTPYKDYGASLVAALGNYEFVYYNAAAAIEITSSQIVDKGTTLNVLNISGKDNDEYYYSGAEKELSATERELLFVPRHITSVQGWNMLAEANDASSDNLANIGTVSVTKDFTVDAAENEFMPLLGFGGTLDVWHTITLCGFAFDDLIVSVEGGSVNGLVLALRNSTSVTTLLDGVTNSAVIAYYGASGYHAEDEGISVVNVHNDGTLTARFVEGALQFVAAAKGNYSLYSWTNDDDEVINGSEGAPNLVYVADGSVVSANFELCYNVKLAYVNNDALASDDLKNISDEVIKNNASDLPVFGGVGIRWAKDMQVVGGKFDIVLTLENCGNSFMYWGMLAQSGNETVDCTDLGAVKVTCTSGCYDITLNVMLSKVVLPWDNFTYNASTQEVSDAVVSSLITAAEGYFGASASVDYAYKALGLTPALVDGKPYHAGTYSVNCLVTVGGTVICNAASGVTVAPKKLAFDSVEVQNKVYDGTDTATVKEGSLAISGFVGDDEGYVGFDALTFRFESAAAAKGKTVSIGNNAELQYVNAENDADGMHRFAHLDYCFDAGVISLSNGGGIVRADIQRASLALSVESVYVDYVSQFEAMPEYSVQCEGFVSDAEKQAYSDSIKALVTREKADCFDVGYYRILVKNSFALDNYEVTITGTAAYYVVTPTPVKMVFDREETVYGTVPETPAYHVEGANGMREGDELYFAKVVYNNGNLMTVSDTLYGVSCVFAPTNKNYVLDGEYEYVMYEGTLCAVLGAEGVLKVNKRNITVQATGANAKTVGKSGETIGVALATGSTLAYASQRLVAVRESGESAGRYKISYKVFDEETDVTEYYDIAPLAADGYYFTVNPVAIRIVPKVTEITYGESLNAVAYSVKVGDEGISLADLYKAIYGTDKANVTLADIGITATVGYANATESLNVGTYNAELRVNYNTEQARENVSAVTMSENAGAGKIVVKQRGIVVTVKDGSKTYDGEEVKQSALTFTVAGVLSADTSKIKVVAKEYKFNSTPISVGSYKVGGTFEVQPTASKYADVALNYSISVQQGKFEITKASVTLNAFLGRYDEEGNFVPAVISRSDGDYEYSIYYGDNTALLHFELTGKTSFIKVSGTDKEKSEALISALKLSYKKLCQLIPAPSMKADEAGLVSTNNNVNVKFNVKLNVEPVSITIRIKTATKVIGEDDPGIAYDLIAQDPNDGYSNIKGYWDLTQGSLKVVITGVRKEGEALGTYKYTDVVCDIINTYTKESLFDEESEIGKELAVDMYQENLDGAKLVIKEKSFIKTIGGKVLAYGGPLAACAAGAVLAIVLGGKAIKRKKLKKQGNSEADAENGTDADNGSESGDAAEQEAGTSTAENADAAKGAGQNDAGDKDASDDNN